MSRLVAFAMFLVSPLLAQSQSLPQGFGWFATLAGSCWSADFPDGKTRHEQCYTTQFNRFMRGTATLAAEKDGTHVIAFSGDSHFAWNEVKRAMDYYIWGSDGSYRQLEARYEGDELHFPIPSRTEPQKVSLRSVWRRVDSNTFEVRRERLADGAWKQEFAVTYRRAGTSQ